MIILIANIGSTSFKYRLVEMPSERVLAEGKVERIGHGECPDYEAAIGRCLSEIIGQNRPLSSLSELGAVGFKAVHGGPLGGTRLVDDRVLQAMQEFAFFAPAHNPPYVAAMRAFGRAAPSVPRVAVFETEFFDSLDEATTTYAVPYSWKEELGVRRYGFHGASHRAASDRIRAILGRTDLRHISCHLGGSSSLAAIRAGRAIDTSFGISPQSGLPQNNRVGDLDVFAALYVMKRKGLNVDAMADILGSRSGLEGVSGTSGDVRDLGEASAAGDRRAQLALDMFVRGVRKYLGAFLVELGGADVITFSGGIGENSVEVRSRACAGLSELGIDIDVVKNASLRGEGPISTAASRVVVWVIPADEERIVARKTAEVAGRALL